MATLLLIKLSLMYTQQTINSSLKNYQMLTLGDIWRWQRQLNQTKSIMIQFDCYWHFKSRTKLKFLIGFNNTFNPSSNSLKPIVRPSVCPFVKVTFGPEGP